MKYKWFIKTPQSAPNYVGVTLPPFALPRGHTRQNSHIDVHLAIDFHQSTMFTGLTRFSAPKYDKYGASFY